MGEQKVPYPGSQAAVELGCRCPVIDNCHGKGALGKPGQFWYSADCPVHFPLPTSADAPPPPSGSDG